MYFKRKTVVILLLVFLLTDVSLLALSGASPYGLGLAQGYQANISPTDHMKIVLPLYSFENKTWQQAIDAAPTVGIIIMNPDSGPGVSAQPTILPFVKSAQQRGILVLGYISTSYASGLVTIRSAEEEIDNYYAWYHVDGILFDEANNTCASQVVTYYSTLYNYTKAKAGPDIVILNPGTATGMCYEPISDILVIFEGNYNTYVNRYASNDWVRQYPATHFLAIVYNAESLGLMQNAVRLASGRNIGLVYVTNLDNNDALATLPSYFSQELIAVNATQNLGSFESYFILLSLVIVVGVVGVVLAVLKRRQKIFERNSNRGEILSKGGSQK